jgi:large subunit ribosomal protein L2
MALRKYKPTTAGTRWRIGNAYEEVTTNIPEKSLLEKQKNTAGRNVQGRRSMRYMGGGNKTMYRIIDFKRNKKNIPAVVKTIEYDPNRTARLALLFYADGEKRYIVAPLDLKVGDSVMAGPTAEIRTGNSLPISNNFTAASMRNSFPKVAASVFSASKIFSGISIVIC